MFNKEHMKIMEDHFMSFGFDNGPELVAMYRNQEKWCNRAIKLFILSFVVAWIALFWPPLYITWAVLMGGGIFSFVYGIFLWRKFRQVWKESSNRFFYTKYGRPYGR